MRTRKHARLLASVAAVALVVTACGGKSDGAKSSDSTKESGTASANATASASESATASGSATATESGTASATGSETAESAPVDPADAKMTITYTLSDVAVWNDGNPMSVDDFRCTWNAMNNTPGSIATAGYEEIIAVEPGASDKEIVVSFKEKYAAWKDLFQPGQIFQASKFDDCNDLSEAFPAEAYNVAAGPYVMTEWTPEQMVYTKNAGYKGKNTGGPEKIVFVPAEDGVTLLKAGTVDFINPQAFTGIDKELADPKIKYDTKPGGSFETLYFMQDPACTPDATRSCAFVDKAYREAFFKSMDMEAFYQQIYAPFAQGLPLLTCGPIVPGPYCDESNFKDTYDPEGAAKILTDAGWKKGADGMWANPKGEVPEVHWMVNTGNPRREDSQTFMIPKLAAAGFKVAADNCEATPCVFQKRLPSEQYDLAMYISNVSPDPGYIATNYRCDQVPSEANDFQGQNTTGWCNKEADAALVASDQELDEAKRTEQIKTGIAAMRADTVLMPTLQFPSIGAYRTDKVSGTQNNLANFWPFNDWYNFKDLDGDGQVVIGAEQYPTPDCANAVTDCATSSWFKNLAAFPSFPGMYVTTEALGYEPSEFMAGEAKVETK